MFQIPSSVSDILPRDEASLHAIIMVFERQAKAVSGILREWFGHALDACREGLGHFLNPCHLCL